MTAMRFVPEVINLLELITSCMPWVTSSLQNKKDLLISVSALTPIHLTCTNVKPHL